MLIIIRGDEQGLVCENQQDCIADIDFHIRDLQISASLSEFYLLSDSRHGNYLINKARSVIFTTTFSPLIFFIPRLLFVLSISRY
jgi:8-amino-7-oxononanoate synthase